MLWRRDKNMLSIYLFRVKFIRGDNLALENEELKPSELFKKAIEERPAIELSTNSVWMIGNVTYLDKECKTGTFNVGKKSIESIPKYNEDSKNFESILEESCPNAKIFFNIEYEILGISNNSSLANDEYSIADKIQKLLEKTNTVTNSFKYIEISKIKNPESFISRLRGAYCIKRFAVHFSGPNPFDADEVFHKPMSAYLNATAGKKGYTVVDGESLNSETCAQMAISIAATGNDASAKIQESSDDKLSTISLSKNGAKVSIKNGIRNDDIKIMELIMNKYFKVK